MTDEAAKNAWENEFWRTFTKWRFIESLARTPSPHFDGKPLFHYTDAAGLKGIIESNSLRATATNYLNDSSEIEYGCALLDEVLEEWLAANKDNFSHAVIVLRSLRDQFGAPASKF